MKTVIDFLTELQRNNNKEWFDSHKDTYRRALAEFNGFVERLIPAVASFDPDIARLTVRDCTYRIYRDTRFSRNKQPYKTYMGAYLCRHGKKSGFAGYYFHIEPEYSVENGAKIGYSMLSSGLYCPEPKILRSVREEVFDNGAQFERAIRCAEGFELYTANSLKRNPAGFPAGPYDTYVRLKDFYLERRLPGEKVADRGLLEYVVECLRPTLAFVEQLNRAIAYAYEEM